MIENYDILIVGGGPSGAAAALQASKLKLKTLVVERNQFPRDKTCGDGIAFSTLTLLEKLGLSKEIFTEQINYSAENKIRLICENDKIVELKNNLFFTLQRETFDYLLWKHIPQEITKIENSEIVQIEKGMNDYEVELKSHDSSFKIKTRFIIGADGYSSQIKRTFFKDLEYPVRIASRYYLQSEFPITNSFDFYFLPEITPGYFWVFKAGPNVFNTGIYLRSNEKSSNLFELHKRMLKKIFQHEIDKNNYFSWPIPNNSNFSVLQKENIFLTGDAAGICDIFLGQGIDSAIISGQLVIQSFDYFENQNGNKYSLSEIYRYKLNSHIGEMIQNAEKLYEALNTNRNKTYEILFENCQNLM